MHVPVLWDFLPLPGSFLQPASPPSFQTLSLIFYQGNLFFSWTLVFGVEPQAPGFPHLNSLCAEAQHMISLVIGGNVSYLFISQRIQNMPLLFSPNVTKICSQPVSVATRAGFCSRVQNFNFRCSDMCTHSSRVVCCLHTLSYFLQCGVRQFYRYWLLMLYMQKRIDMCFKISVIFSSGSKFFRRVSSWDDPLNSSHPRVPACSVIVVSSCLSHGRFY